MLNRKKALMGLAIGGASLYGLGCTGLYLKTRKNNETLLKDTAKSSERSKDLEEQIRIISKNLGMEIGEKCELADQLSQVEERNGKLEASLQAQRVLHKNEKKIIMERNAETVRELNKRLQETDQVVNDLSDEIIRLNREITRLQQNP